MIITCDECNSSFSINDGMIKDTGSKVRCSKCDNVFVALPQSTEDELALDSQDPMLGEDEDLGLDDLDSDFSDFLEDDDADETFAVSSEPAESELDLDDFDDSLELESDLEPDDLLDEPEGELELDLDFDQDEESDPALNVDSIDGDDFPDLDDLDDLDDEELTSDEADSELEDLDFELESDTEAALDLAGEDELDLTDLGLEEDAALEDPSAEQEAAFEAGESDEMDLSDLEAAIDGESAPAETAASDLADLSLEADEPDAAEIAAAGFAEETSDALDLSDLDLDMEDAALSEEAPAAASEDLDLNLDLDLDLEAEPVADGQLDAADELDLSDLTDIIDDGQAPAAEAQPEELDFDLEFGSEASTGAEEPAAVTDTDDTDELDLSALEDVVETEQAPAARAPTDDSSQGLDMDLDFQTEEGAPMSETTFDPQGDDELDFSDLEQMLESDETPSVDATDTSMAEELDLQFDLDQPPAAGAGTEASADSGADAQEDDFLDIEQLLDEGEDSAPMAGAGLDGDVTDLPLEMEAALVDASNGADAELELDFDLESELQADDDEDFFESGDSTDQQLESNLLASDEMDVLEEAGTEESEYQDPTETSVVGADEFSADALNDTHSAYGATHVLPGAEGEIAPDAEIAPDSEITIEDPEFAPYLPQRKARSKKPVLAVMLLLLVALGVFTIPNMLGIKIPYISDVKIPYLSDLDVNKIPYLREWLNPGPQDVAGNLKITPLGNTIDGQFVDNSKSGQLFVIQGQIKNDYDHPRSYIKVTGKLFRKGKKIAKTATVYCGNMLSESDLSAMDITAITKKLGNRTGDQRSNFKVQTGKQVPFMIVFDKLPRNLDEYTVEVEGSSI